RSKSVSWFAPGIPPRSAVVLIGSTCIIIPVLTCQLSPIPTLAQVMVVRRTLLLLFELVYQRVGNMNLFTCNIVRYGLNWLIHICFSDNAYGRIAEFVVGARKDNTVQSCIEACAEQGYTVAGTEFGTECCEIYMPQRTIYVNSLCIDCGQ